MTVTDIRWWRNSFGDAELEQIKYAVEHEHISMGVKTAEFERAFAKELDVSYAVAATSGSVALLMAMMALNIGRGDEVIVPNRTWIATASAPCMIGAKVVLVDVEKDKPLMDVTKIEEKITSKTKAILPVHLGGAGCDMKAVMDIANKHNIAVVEDAAQSVFSKNNGKFLGTHGLMGCFSFSVTKLLSTAQGGMIVTQDKELYDKLRLIRWHGAGDNIKPHYDIIGCNFKFTDIQASMGLAQLARKKQKIESVKAIYTAYKEGLKDTPVVLNPVDLATEVPQYVEASCPDYPALEKYLTNKGIDVRPSLPNLTSAHYLHDNGQYPNSDYFDKHGFYFPCGPDQPMTSIQRVIDVTKEFYHE